MFHSKLVGVTFKNEHGIPIQKVLAKLDDEVYDGKEIILERNHDLPGHPNAIKAYSLDGDHIGHISSDVAEELAPLIDKGSQVRTFCSNITGGGGKNFGCNIKVYIGDEADNIPVDMTGIIVKVIFAVSALIIAGPVIWFFWKCF